MSAAPVVTHARLIFVPMTTICKCNRCRRLAAAGFYQTVWELPREMQHDRPRLRRMENNVAFGKQICVN
jgi:hypothetical protein